VCGRKREREREKYGAEGRKSEKKGGMSERK